MNGGKLYFSQRNIGKATEDGEKKTKNTQQTGKTALAWGIEKI